MKFPVIPAAVSEFDLVFGLLIGNSLAVLSGRCLGPCAGALGILLTAPLLFAAGILALERQKHLLLAGTVLWFATAPLWMKED